MKISLFFAGILFQLSLQIFSQGPTSGLIGYWPFNGNVNDSSTSLNHGTIINGATFTNDRFNNADHAIQLVKSSSQYITVNHSPSLQINNAISASFWIKRNTLGGQDQVLNKGGDWPSGTCNYGIAFSDWTLVFIYNGGYYIVNSPGVPQDYDWHHYVVTAVHGTTEVHFFVDGVEKPSLFGGGNANVDLSSSSSSDLYIGGVHYFSNNAMDDLRLYNRLLTPGEIQSLYSGLIAYLPFNGNVSDESGNGHDGNINGNATLTSDRFNTANRAFTSPDQSSNISLANTSDLNLENGFTINAWIKYKNTYSVIVCKHVCGIVNGFVLGIDYDGQIQLWIGNSVWSTVKTNAAFIENQWYMVTATYDASTGIAKVYVNEEVSGSGNVIYNNFSSYPISIGEAYQNNCQAANMSGAVDEVKIYNRSLSEEEISQEYNLTRSSLIAYYPFNGNANDESGNGNNGTINGVINLTADRFGNADKAYSFWHPGYISVVNNPLFFADELTISYWYKIASYFGERGVLSGVGGSGGYQQYFVGTTFAYMMGYNFPLSSTPFSSNYLMPDITNTWQHVAVTYQKTGDNSSVTKLYINGALKNTENPLMTIAFPAGETFYIGQNHGGVNFNGELDDIRIFNCLLNETEIDSLFRENLTIDLEDKLISDIKISPNPTNGEINVDLGSIYKKVQIKLFDLSGRLIIEKEYHDEQRFLLNLDEPSGMYILTILYDNKKATLKLIKEYN